MRRPRGWIPPGLGEGGEGGQEASRAGQQEPGAAWEGVGVERRGVDPQSLAHCWEEPGCSLVEVGTREGPEQGKVWSGLGSERIHLAVCGKWAVGSEEGRGTSGEAVPAVVQAKGRGGGAQEVAVEVGGGEESVSSCSAPVLKGELAGRTAGPHVGDSGFQEEWPEEGVSTSGSCPGPGPAPTGGRLWSSPSPAPRGTCARPFPSTVGLAF